MHSNFLAFIIHCTPDHWASFWIKDMIYVTLMHSRRKRCHSMMRSIDYVVRYSGSGWITCCGIDWSCLHGHHISVLEDHEIRTHLLPCYHSHRMIWEQSLLYKTVKGVVGDISLSSRHHCRLSIAILSLVVEPRSCVDKGIIKLFQLETSFL